jgi:hypothetical protein
MDKLQNATKAKRQNGINILNEEAKAYKQSVVC